MTTTPTTPKRPWTAGLEKLRYLVLSQRAAVGIDPHGPIRDEKLAELDAADHALSAGPAMFEALKGLAEHCDNMEAQHQDYHTEEGPRRSQPLCEAYAALAAALPPEGDA